MLKALERFLPCHSTTLKEKRPVNPNDILKRRINEVDLCLSVHHAAVETTFHGLARRLFRAAYIFADLPDDLRYAFEKDKRAPLKTPSEQFKAIKEEMCLGLHVDPADNAANAYINAIAEAGKTCASLHEESKKQSLATEGINEYLNEIRREISNLENQVYMKSQTIRREENSNLTK